MPEARDRLPGEETRDMALGFGIRPEFYVAAQSRNGHDRDRNLYRSLSDNKENIPPESSRSSRRRTRPRKSPLPSWYPRTPLRDITAVVNAMERRRNRLRAAAELRRRNQGTANSSPIPLLTSPLAHELSDSEQAPPPIQDQEPSLSASDLFPYQSPTLKNPLLPAEDTATPLETSPSIENSASHGKNTVATDKKFSDSFDEIERIVMENFHRMAKRTTKKSERSTLMSMR